MKNSCVNAISLAKKMAAKLHRNAVILCEIHSNLVDGLCLPDDRETFQMAVKFCREVKAILDSERPDWIKAQEIKALLSGVFEDDYRADIFLKEYCEIEIKKDSKQ